HELNSKQVAAQRAKIGMVFQQFNLFPHRTVLQNIIDAPVRVKKQSRQQAIEKARSLLQQVGLASRENDWPAQLSGGQQQRVAIARAIVSDPTFLICDEPTGDLDRQSAEEILGLLQQLNREHGKTIIMVTHDPKAAEYATHTVHLDKGELADAPLAH
uniref:ABC transporter ATP-binding protein n=1 Tax=Rouxiella chamberiensis TaxID=1513468 RepID=UPI0005D3D54F